MDVHGTLLPARMRLLKVIYQCSNGRGRMAVRGMKIRVPSQLKVDISLHWNGPEEMVVRGINLQSCLPNKLVIWSYLLGRKIMDVHRTSQWNNRSDRCSKSCRSTNINNTNLLSSSTKNSISHFLKLFIVTRFGDWRRWLVQQKCHDPLRKVQGIISSNDWVDYLKLTTLSWSSAKQISKLPAVWIFLSFSTKEGPRNVSSETWLIRFEWMSNIRIRLSHQMDMVREPNRWGTSFWRLHLRVRMEY